MISIFLTGKPFSTIAFCRIRFLFHGISLLEICGLYFLFSIKGFFYPTNKRRPSPSFFNYSRTEVAFGFFYPRPHLNLLLEKRRGHDCEI